MPGTAISDDFMRAELARTRAYSLVLLRRGPAYEPAEARRPAQAKIVWEHGRRNFELRAAGKLALVGPVTGGEVVGLYVFATDPKETAALMAADPAVQATIFTFDIFSFFGFPGDGLPE